MKKLFVLLGFFLLYAFNCLGQTISLDLARNEMKYWKLRGRLTGDENNRDQYNGFLVVGQNNGEGIPAVQRYPTYKSRELFSNHNFSREAFYSDDF